jgi:hypothetical protein
MWIRDDALKYVPGMRAILYGYDSKLVNTDSFQRIGDLSVSFISQIRANGGTLSDAKPLVFLAHSLGGIVLKDAFCRLANSQADSLERRIFSRCKGALMFGVPNFGMEQNHLLSVVQGNPTEALVRDLSRESGTYGYLKRLELSLSGIAEVGDMTIYWAFETSTSPTFNPETGDMTGPRSILVDPDSATGHGVKDFPAFVHPIGRTHSDMVKLTRSDPNTGPIIELLRRVCGLDSIQDGNPDNDRFSSTQSRTVAWSHTEMNTYWHQTGESDEKRLLCVLEEFMTALDSSDLDIRQSLIVDRFENTCEWVYQNKAFVTWLGQECGVFWIYGKPGSGKSTLMKLVHADKRTRQHSHTFGTSSCQITAEFFFNFRGTYLQKTLEGLVRSFLRQIMSRLSKFNTGGANALLNALLQSPSFRHPSDLHGQCPASKNLWELYLNRTESTFRSRFSSTHLMNLMGHRSTYPALSRILSAS